ncbi:hypothetical protein J2X68_006856 [Streptomyces sp. 3330]|nr:hypothetical protein [Streptomyces sp. 3330]
MTPATATPVQTPSLMLRPSGSTRRTCPAERRLVRGCGSPAGSFERPLAFSYRPAKGCPPTSTGIRRRVPPQECNGGPRSPESGADPCRLRLRLRRACGIPSHS